MSKKSKIILMWGMFFVFSLLSIGQMNFLWAEKSDNVNPYMVKYVAKFSPSDLSFDKQIGYDIVGIIDGDYLGALGKPMLPYKMLKVALPMGMTAKKV